MAEFNMKSKPKGLFKWLLHAPTFIYRARLGFVFGHRLLMIEHRGRKSGTRYTTVLEVAGRKPDRNEYMVTSGTGPKADWYLNILANGIEAVWIGSQRHHGTVRSLEPTEAAEVFHRYELAHPKTAARLEDTMGVSYDGTDQGRIEMMQKIPMVGITITD
jgi:deazaflavin-dependent oxidoreductase (nitroreductase family)